MRKSVPDHCAGKLRCWSLACASHGLAAGFGMLAVSRFLLGVGECGGFPAATKAVSEWFPARERSTLNIKNLCG